MKWQLTITVETEPKKKFKEDGEDITSFVDRTICRAICDKIEKGITDNDEFEEEVLNSSEADELPEKIKEFSDFGSVSIKIIGNEIIGQKCLNGFNKE